MAVITKTDLENAKEDAEDLGAIVNGPADLGGTGLVSTRYGGDVPTVKKLFEDITNGGDAWVINQGEQNAAEAGVTVIQERNDDFPVESQIVTFRGYDALITNTDVNNALLQSAFRARINDTYNAFNALTTGEVMMNSGTGNGASVGAIGDNLKLGFGANTVQGLPNNAAGAYLRWEGTVGEVVFVTWNGSNRTHFLHAGAFVNESGTGRYEYEVAASAGKSEVDVVYYIGSSAIGAVCNINDYGQTPTHANPLFAITSETTTGDLQHWRKYVSGTVTTLAKVDKMGRAQFPVLDLPEQVSPGDPAADVARLYGKDVAGATRVAFRDSAGTETVLAGLASPEFTGTPRVPTATANDNSTTVASTAYVDTAVATAAAGLYDLKTQIDCSANPNYPAALKGDVYFVSVAGKVGGASGITVAAGDSIVAMADNAGGTQASVGTSWAATEHNLVGPLLSANNLSDIASQAGARTNLGLGTIATQDASAVTITGGSLAGITSLTLTPAANAAGASMTGASLTGSNASSFIDYAGTWNTSGNPTAFKLNITNTASGASALLCDYQVGGVSQFKVSKGGDVIITATLSAGANITLPSSGIFAFVGSSRIKAPSDGVFTFYNAASSDFARLQLGGTTSSFPALKRSGTAVQARLADDSAFASLQGKLTTDTNYTAGAIVPTGYITLYDATGTAYKIPCVL